ncbi:hypothetical protein RRG08_036618 [Elysia crispata]|uniref:Uncharacterized protein n=1 Tax=Elysia crispata TaxID=231223 RepID=A0AAE1DR78_9GAST|nr:hypothetical protein RRG08_036618 [Elysia crispata]
MTEKFSNFQINRFKESFDPTKEPENLICAYLLEIHEKGGWDTHKLRRAKFDLIWHGGIEHNHHLVRVVLPSPPRGSGENLSGNQNSLGLVTDNFEVNGYLIPKGSQLLLNVNSDLQDEEIYGTVQERLSPRDSSTLTASSRGRMSSLPLVQVAVFVQWKPWLESSSTSFCPPCFKDRRAELPLLKVFRA